MAAKDYGVAHLFGINFTVTNATVLSFDGDADLANRATTENEIGNVIERRSDDLTFTGTLQLKVRNGYSAPAPGDILTLTNPLTGVSTKYEVTKVAFAFKNKDFRIFNTSVVTNEYITLP